MHVRAIEIRLAYIAFLCETLPNSLRPTQKHVLDCCYGRMRSHRVEHCLAMTSQRCRECVTMSHVSFVPAVPEQHQIWLPS